MNSTIKHSWAEPYKMKMVELLKMTTPSQRKKALAEAGYNTFLLRSEDVYIDLLTDSGTSAMSDRQWAGMMLGDEAYDTESEHPFKGNDDMDKLDRLVKKYGAKKIPYVSIATSVNMAGGQPISIRNLKELRGFTKKHHIRIIHDMTRVAENAYFIQ